jgi:hypothetical protein
MGSWPMDGWSEADILANHPGLAHADITACLAYARDLLRSEKVFPSAARARLAAIITTRDDWAGSFSVVEPGRVRMHRLRDAPQT